MGHSSPQLNPENRLCTEEEIFFRIVSGLQTCIMVLSAEYNHPRTDPLVQMEMLEQLKAERRWLDAESFRAMHAPNLNLMKDRVAPVKEWIENLFVDFGVLLQTFCKLHPILTHVDCDTGDPQEDRAAQTALRKLLEISFETCEHTSMHKSVGPLFDRKQELAMRQFANISRIMDCLECEKCRLHGKVKIVALQLALRSSGPTSIKALERNELIALINALDYFADGIVVIERFRARLRRIRFLWGVGITIVCGTIAAAVSVLRKKQLRKKKKE